MKPVNNVELTRVLKSLNAYSAERRRFLKSIDWLGSNRDPFSVVSEIIVQHLMGGQLAGNQVQARWDLIDANGREVQVKYLANTEKTWANAHDVVFPTGVGIYALVIFEAHSPQTVVVFNKEHIGHLCNRLDKRHGNQDRGIQFTQRNYLEVLQNVEKFELENLVSVFQVGRYFRSDQLMK